VLLAFVPIEPGETFSFNEHVGPRDRSHDFWLAPVIANGELTDGPGGGVCQVSSTLHAAARLARLTVTERTPHTRSSSYIAPGLDATVVYPDKDLKLRNDGTSSVILTLRAQLGVLIAEVLSESPPDAAVPTYSFKVGLTGQPSGAHTKAGCPTKLVQKGTDGHVVWSTLTSSNGSKTTWLSAYPPIDEVWQVCPSEKLPRDN
jgi:vancomycin resistance protein YoaR